MKKPLYCVRQNGIGEYLSSDITHALRWIALKIGKPVAFITCAEAVALNYSVDRV